MELRVGGDGPSDGHELDMREHSRHERSGISGVTPSAPGRRSATHCSHWRPSANEKRHIPKTWRILLQPFPPALNPTERLSVTYRNYSDAVKTLVAPSHE
jgi:hypothetical protein